MRELLTRLEQASVLDRISDPLQRGLQAVIKPRLLRDLLHGVFLGHPVHPPLATFTLGSWTSASVLDFLARHETAATTMVGLGLASSPLTVAAGAADWSELDHEQRRVGLIPLTLNGA